MTMKRLLFLTLLTTMATLPNGLPAQIESISAGPDTITVNLEAGANGPARLLDVPIHEEPTFDSTHQGWALTGFGGALSFDNGNAEITFVDPGADPFDPNISYTAPVQAGLVDQLAIRLRYTNPDDGSAFPVGAFTFPQDYSSFGYASTTMSPSTEWQILRIDLSTAAPTTWEGTRWLRLDIPDAGSFAQFENALVEIDWIALSNDPTFDGTVVDGNDLLWDFEGSRKAWIGTLDDSITIGRFDGPRDRLFSQFLLEDGAGNILDGPKFVVDIESGDKLPNENLGFYSPNDSTLLDFSTTHLTMTFVEPTAPNPFDPIIQSILPVDMTPLTHLRARVRYTNPSDSSPQSAGIYFFPDAGGLQIASGTVTGDGEWRIVDIPLVDGSTSDPFAGKGTFRIDFPDGISYSQAAGAVLEMDWLLLTDNPGVTPATVSATDYFWDFGGGVSREFAFAPKPSIKGLQVEWIEDALDLGINFAAQNIIQSALFDMGNNSQITWEVDGQTFHFNPAYIQFLDDQVSRLTRGGAAVYMIFLNQIPGTANPNNPFIHPLTLPEEAQNNLGAFNLTTEQGFRHYRAALEFVTHRYSHPTSPLGQVRGYIIGNEIQSHFFWHNIGYQEPDVVMRDYEKSVRMADLAIRRIAPNVKTYISLDHYWDRRPIDGANNNNRTMNGKEFVDSFAAWVRERGDFPWHVAHHPYPHNLNNPEFWGSGSDSAFFSFSTRRITYKNIEILPAYMGREDMRFRGERRSIILSEQGFNSPNTSNGEQRQAAAFAWGWHRVRHTDGIDAHMLHRHIDNRFEGGLRLGLWTEDGDAPGPSVPLNQKEIYTLFKYSDAPDWQDYFDPYLPFLPISTWEEGLPARGNMRFLFTDSMEGWSSTGDISGLAIDNEKLVGTTTGNTPTLRRLNLLISPQQIETIVLDITTTGGTAGRLYWGTNENPGFNISRSIPFNLTGKSNMVTLDMTATPGWNDDEFITELQLVPVENTPGTEFSIAYIIGDFDDLLDLPSATIPKWDLFIVD